MGKGAGGLLGSRLVPHAQHESQGDVSDLPGRREVEPLAPWWTLNQRDIARKYTNAKTQTVISMAVLELEEHDILVVNRDSSDYGGDYNEREPNIYRLKELMAPEDIKKAMILGNAYLEANKDEEAVRIFEEVIKADSSNVRAYKMLSFAMRRAYTQGYDPRISMDHNYLKIL